MMGYSATSKSNRETKTLLMPLSSEAFALSILKVRKKILELLTHVANRVTGYWGYIRDGKIVGNSCYYVAYVFCSV